MVPLDNGAMNQMNQMNDGWWRWMLMAKSDEDGGSWQARLRQGAICGVKKTQPRDVGPAQAMYSKLRSITDESSRRRWRVKCLVEAGAMQRMKAYGKRANMG
jgi:hypothetical protein